MFFHKELNLSRFRFSSFYSLSFSSFWASLYPLISLLEPILSEFIVQFLHHNPTFFIFSRLLYKNTKGGISSPLCSKTLSVLSEKLPRLPLLLQKKNYLKIFSEKFHVYFSRGIFNFSNSNFFLLIFLSSPQK